MKVCLACGCEDIFTLENGNEVLYICMKCGYEKKDLPKIRVREGEKVSVSYRETVMDLARFFPSSVVLEYVMLSCDKKSIIEGE